MVTERTAELSDRNFRWRKASRLRLSMLLFIRLFRSSNKFYLEVMAIRVQSFYDIVLVEWKGNMKIIRGTKSALHRRCLSILRLWLMRRGRTLLTAGKYEYLEEERERFKLPPVLRNLYFSNVNRGFHLSSAHLFLERFIWIFSRLLYPLTGTNRKFQSSDQLETRWHLCAPAFA